jgi:hypothetical protein
MKLSPKTILILLIVALGIGGGIMSKMWNTERKSRIRMTDNYKHSSDSVRIALLTTKELRRLKKESDDKHLSIVDSIQKKYNIKDQQLNAAEHLIIKYKSAQNYVLKPRMDTLYLPGKVVEKTAPKPDSSMVVVGGYTFNDGCMFFDAKITFDGGMEMEVTNPGFKAEAVIIDFTKRRRILWGVGPRLGRKEGKIIAETNGCGEITVTKYKKVRR